MKWQKENLFSKKWRVIIENAMSKKMWIVKYSSLRFYQFDATEMNGNNKESNQTNRVCFMSSFGCAKANWSSTVRCTKASNKKLEEKIIKKMEFRNISFIHSTVHALLDTSKCDGFLF